MMKPSEFQTTIENQFDYICKVAMEDERKDYLKALSRQCKRETLFCDMDDYTVNLFSSEDTYPSHFHTFEMDGFTVRIENSLLAEALENLDGKKRDVILRYYFLGFDDTEISKNFFYLIHIVVTGNIFFSDSFPITQALGIAFCVYALIVNLGKFTPSAAKTGRSIRRKRRLFPTAAAGSKKQLKS